MGLNPVGSRPSKSCRETIDVWMERQRRAGRVANKGVNADAPHRLPPAIMRSDKLEGYLNGKIRHPKKTDKISSSN